MKLLESAELFAKGKYSRDLRRGNTEAELQHLENVVNRLKSLGVIDEEILCTGWLYDTMEKTNTSFDELLEKFGTRIAVMVWSLSRDDKLTKKLREKQYVKQLRGASFDAKLIKLCDISANLTKLKKQNVSKSKKMRNIKQTRRYLAAIKKELEEETDYPGTITILESINQVMNQLCQRPKIINNNS